MKTKETFIALTGIITFIYLMFAGIYLNYTHEQEQRRVDTHSKILASAMWDFDVKNMTDYCQLASKAYNYKHIWVAKQNGEKILDVQSSLQSPVDRFLFSLGLLPTTDITSAINYRNMTIGSITVTWHNAVIYTLAYALIIVLLIIVILWFFIRNIRAKQELEIRVADRTAHLQKEITERELAENELKQYAQKLAIHIENTPLGVIEFNPDFKVVQWNQAAEQIFGYTREEAIGQKTEDIILPKTSLNHVEEVWRDLLAKRGGTRSTNQNITKDGKTLTCEWYNTVLVDPRDQVVGVASLVMDISEAENLAEQLRQAYKMEAIGTMAGGIAHDFNNILAAMLGFADMALFDIPDTNPAKYKIEQVLMAGNRAKELVQHILSFSRKEAKEKFPTQIHLLIQETLKLLRASIPTTIEIEQNIDPLCCNILADPTQIHQVLMNLCTNAAQSMEESGGTLEVILSEVQLTVEDLKHEPHLSPGRYACLTVKDSGIGIAQENQDKVFDPYFTTKEVGKGSGMGLAVVVGIVKSHDGMITVDSKAGAGTTFNVYLPAIEEQALKTIEDTAPVPTGTEKILVVDDEEIIVDMTKKRLVKLGYQVTTRTRSVDALELFCSAPDFFDLVITDQTMPQLTGEQLAKKLIEVRSDTPIIICTGYSSRIDAEKAKFVGIRAFLAKPIDTRELAKAIRQVLNHETNFVY